MRFDILFWDVTSVCVAGSLADYSQAECNNLLDYG